MTKPILTGFTAFLMSCLFVADVSSFYSFEPSMDLFYDAVSSNLQMQRRVQEQQQITAAMPLCLALAWLKEHKNPQLASFSEELELCDTNFWDEYGLTPQATWLDGSKLTPMSDDLFVVSGGTRRPFSDQVMNNHYAWAYSRGVNYQYFDLPVSLCSAEDCADTPENRIRRSYGEKQHYWAKIAIIRHVLDTGQISEGKWLVWLDDDVIVNDYLSPVSTLNRIIEHFGSQHSLLVSEGYSDDGVNAGILFIRNDQQGRDIIEEIWNQSDDRRLGYAGQREQSTHDQEALQNIIDGKTFDHIDKSNPGKEFIILGDSEGRLADSIRVIPQRSEAGNFNTLAWPDNLKKMKPKFGVGIRYDHVLANKQLDAFIQHPAPALYEYDMSKKEYIAQTQRMMRYNYPLNINVRATALYLALAAFCSTHLHGRFVDNFAYDDGLLKTMPVIQDIFYFSDALQTELMQIAKHDEGQGLESSIMAFIETIEQLENDTEFLGAVRRLRYLNTFEGINKLNLLQRMSTSSHLRIKAIMEQRKG